jgi:hypothetical protein
LFTTELSLRQGRFEPLARLAKAPDFVSRWMNVSPTAAAAALLIDHAAATLSGEEIAAGRGEGSYRLLCETFPPGDRAETCAEIRSLRPPFKVPSDEAARQKLAQKALERLVKQASAPPKSATTPPAPSP